MGVKGIFRFFFNRAIEGLVLILLLLFLPNLPPFCKFERPYKVSPTLPLEGKLAINTRLNNAERWHENELIGPEGFAIYNDEIYTSLYTGEIVKLVNKHIVHIVTIGKPCKHEFDENICGRPLGMQFNQHGDLFVADAYYGIFKVNVKTGEKTQIVSADIEINGIKPKLFNGVAVTKNGDIYYTDSSTDFTLEDGVFDMLSDGSGRVIHYDPKTKINTVLMDNMLFPNGVILSENEDYILITETGKSRVFKYYVSGPNKGNHKVFLDGLPGVPDNIEKDGKGGYLVALVVAHDANHPSIFQILGPFPWIRKFISRVLGLIELGFKGVDYVIPNYYAKMGIHFIGHFTSVNRLLPTPRASIIRVNANGDIIDSIHAMNGRVVGICEAKVYKDQLLLGSPFNNYIGRVNLKDIGWSDLIQSEKVKEVPKVEAAPPKVETPKKQTAPPTQAPKVQTVPPTEAPKAQAAPPTEAPKAQTPPPTEAPKAQTPPPTEAPKTQTPPPTQAPKVQTAPPTEAPKVQTAPPVQAQTPPPTQAPKAQTASPTKPPKVQAAPPTQAPNAQTAAPTHAPKAQAAPPAQASRPQNPPPNVQNEKPAQPPKAQTPTPSKPSLHSASTDKTEVPQTKQTSQNDQPSKAVPKNPPSK